MPKPFSLTTGKFLRLLRRPFPRLPSTTLFHAIRHVSFSSTRVLRNAGFFLRWILFAIGGLSAVSSRAADRAAAAADQPALLVNCSANHYPYSFRNERGEFAGFAVDMLDAVARVMDLKIKRIALTTADNYPTVVPPDLAASQLVPQTIVRDPVFDLTVHYLTLQGAVFVRSGDTRFRSMTDLRDAKARIATGRGGMDYAAKKGIDPAQLFNRSTEAGMRDLVAGRVDAVMLSRLTGLSMIHRSGIENVQLVAGIADDFVLHFGFGVRRGDTRLLALLNEGLAIVYQTGEYERIYQKWFRHFEPAGFSRGEMAGYLAGALALALLIAVWALLRQRDLRQRLTLQAQEIAESRSILAEAQRLAHVGHSQRTLGANESITWSDEIYRIFERDPQQGPPGFKDLINYAVEEDRIRWAEMLQTAGVDGKPYEMEVRIAPRPGVLKIIHVRGRPMLNSQGTITGLFGTAQDVTEWRQAQDALSQSEQLLRAFYETLPHGLGVVEQVDDTWRLVSLNPGAVRLFNLASTPSAGTTLAHLGFSAERQLYWAGLFDRSVRETTTLLTEHTDPERKRDYAITLVSLPDSSRRPRCCFFIEDITGRKQKDSEISQGRRLRAIGELVGGIAHEFNNLLTPILLKSDQLQHDPAHTPALRSDLKVITDAARRSADLTRRLLAFGRTHERTVEEIDLHAVLKSNIDLVRQTIDRRIFIASELPPALPALYLNSGDLHQILLNLLLNARDTLAEKLTRPTPADWSPTIEITATLLPASSVTPLQISTGPLPEKWIRLSVGDNGMGMPAAVIERIFEPFYTTKQVGAGTGLGLATVWHLVADLGGRVDVDSTAGTGTVFHISLPVKSRKSVTLASSPKNSASAEPLAPHHLLLVEDEDLISRLVLAVLRRAGHTVEHAANGHIAWELLSTTPARFDAVLMDLNMPGFSGLELARRARALPYDRPIFVMSGRVTEEERAELVRLKIAAVIQKPFTQPELLALLSSGGIAVQGQ